MEVKQVRPTKLIVDTNAIKKNICEINKKLNKNVKIMPTIKANAYGIGVEKMIEIIEELEINIVAVALVDEGIYLRKLGYKGEIFVLNQPYIDEIKQIYENDLTVGVSSLTFIEKLKEFNKSFKIHLEIGTGMGRTGIKPNRCEEVLDKILTCKNIKIEGVYTHFSCSDCDSEYTKHQIFSFKKALSVIKEKIKDLKYIHTCNSAGLINFPEAQYNLVRPGLMLYGYLPNENMKKKIEINPCCTLKSKVSFIKEVEEGFHIGYGKSYITDKRTTVLTVPIGYADGLRRMLSNNGNVIINGKIAPIIGSICMDSFMVDGTDIGEINVGTDVYIWDNKNITVEDVAKKCETINYEILSSITNRVKREYI